MQVNHFKLIVYLLIITLFCISKADAQVGINESDAEPDASAMLDINSQDKGLLVPRLTEKE